MATTQPPIRIAFCITDLDAGGAERALVQLATRLDRSRWQPAVFCLSPPGELITTLEAAGIPVTCFGARRATDVGVVFRLARALRKFQPTILQTFLHHANIAGRFAGGWAGVPHIVSGIRVAERRSGFRLWLDRITNGFVEFNVCVSQGVVEFSTRVGGLKPDKLVVIPNGVDAGLFSNAAPADLTAHGIPAGSRVLITVGRLDQQKGLHYLLEAMPKVLSRDNSVHLLIVGEGAQRCVLEREIIDRQLTGRVHLLGWRNEVPALLKASELFVLSSLWEGMPNVVLEAIAAGLPVVATHVEGISELVRENETGLLVPPGNSEALATGIATVLDDPERAKTWGKVGQNRVFSEFSWGKMVLAYEALYENLLKTGT